MKIGREMVWVQKKEALVKDKNLDFTLCVQSRLRLLKLAPDDVQFFDTEVHCKDGILKNYKLVNITREIKGIDYEKSIYYERSLPGGSVMHYFKYLVYKPGCMGSYKLARDKEYHSHLLATEEIKQAFEKAKIKGMRFVRPEEFFRPLRPEDLVD